MAARALRHSAGRGRIELGRLGPDAVTIGAAVLPLAAFFSSGGHRPRQAQQRPTGPAWRAAVEGRQVRESGVEWRGLATRLRGTCFPRGPHHPPHRLVVRAPPRYRTGTGRDAGA